MVQTTITSGAIAKHQVISRAGRPRYIKSRPLPCQSHIIYAHNKKNQHNGICLPKLFTVHLDADMLDKHVLFFKFLACDLRRKFKNNIQKQPEPDSLKALLQALQGTAALPSSVISLFLVCSQTSYVAVIQIYPSTSLLNYNLYFSSHILCIKCQVCAAIEA